MDSAGILSAEPPRSSTCDVCQGFGDMMNPRGFMTLGETGNPDPGYIYTYVHQPNYEALVASAEGGCRLCKVITFHLNKDHSSIMTQARAQISKQLSPIPRTAQSDNDDFEARRSAEIINNHGGPKSIRRLLVYDKGRVVLIMYCDTGSGPRSRNGLGVYEGLKVCICLPDTDGSIPHCFIPAIVNIYDSVDADAEHRPSHDLLAQPHISLINRWRDTCQTEHESCSEAACIESLPSRVLELGPSDEIDGVQVRLIETQHVMQGSYACLSYCWGGSKIQIGQTTSENLSRQLQGISLHNLPDTVVDAIHLCYKLGFQFLWVDRLCIVQDDEEDWKKEASEMCDIYSRSALTISIPICDQSSQSFLKKRGDANRFGEKKGEAILAYQDKTSGMKGSIFFGSSIDHDLRGASSFLEGPWDSSDRRHGRSETPWLNRGWTFQEWMLSPKVLHIHRVTLWDCFNSYGNETSCRHLARPLLIRHPGQLGSGISWGSIVTEYSERRTTYEKDKLPALAGLAARFHQHTGYTYLAGLWREELPRSLLWRRMRNVTSRGQIQHTSRTTGIPSWSWVAVNRAVEYYMDDTVLKATATLVSDWRQDDPSESFFQVGKAWIDVEGHMSVAKNVYRVSEWLFWTHTLVAGDTHWDCRPDHYPDDEIAQTNFYLLDIGWKVRDGKNLRIHWALVLQRVVGLDDVREYFRRVGIAISGSPALQSRLTWKREVVRIV